MRFQAGSVHEKEWIALVSQVRLRVETKNKKKNQIMTKLKGKAPEAVEPGKTKAMIFGASGVGKTWFTLTFPKPFYVDTEGGADLKHYQERLKVAGGVYLGPADGALDFSTVLEQMQALATETHPYQTLIIDSITKLYQTAIANEAERLGDKDAFGASKKPAIAWMRRLIAWTQKLDMNVWFVAHDIAEWGLDPKTGQRTEIGRMPDVFEKLVYELDLTLHAQKRGQSRVAVVRKSRLLSFPDLETFPLEYSDFAGRYGKEFIEAPTKQFTLATPEQVAEIKRLLSIVKVSEADIEKLMTKAAAETWEELSTDQAVGTIKWLNKKISG